MKKTILILLLIGIGLGGYIYYNKLTTGPEYSLLQAAKAAKQHDPVAFEQYVDVSSVTRKLVDQVLEQEALLTMISPEAAAMRGALRFLKPQLARIARQEVRHFIETGSVKAADGAPEAIANVSVLGLVGGAVGPDSKFKGVKYSHKEGEQALIGLEFTQPRYDTTLVVEVKMQEKGDHWQATEITNAASILKNVARHEKKRHLGQK